MNAKPFKFRYVNEIVGVFVILVALLLVAGVLIAGHYQRWFEPVFRIHVQFPPEGTLGLKKGSPIEMLGSEVGVVEQISVSEEGRMEGLFRVRGEFARFIRTDSVAVVKRKFQVAGDAFVDILTGTGPLVTTLAVPQIECRKDMQIFEIVQQVVEKVEGAVLPAIEELKGLLVEYRGLGEDLRNPEGRVMQALAHLNDILAGLERGEGTAGKLLKDPALADQSKAILEQVNAAMTELRASMDQLNGILKDVKDTTARLPAMAGDAAAMTTTIRGEMRDVPGLALQTQVTLRETERLLAALQKHWLLRAYVEPEVPLDAIPLDSIESGKEVRP